MVDKHGDLKKYLTRQTLIDILPTELNITCTLRFYGFRKNKDFYVMYGLCRYKSHAQRFKFDINYSDNGQVTLFVYSDVAVEVIHDEPRHDYQLTQKVLQAVKPKEMHLEVGRETNKELAADGNMQNLKLLSTFQKAKSEQNCKYDLRLKSNHIGDLMQQCCDDRKTSDPYLQRVGIPIFAMMY